MIGLRIVCTSMVLFWTIQNPCASQYVTTIRDGKNALCLSENKPTYLNPPTVTESKDTTALMDNNKMWDDWLLKSSFDVTGGPITDKRWEDFGTTIDFVKKIPLKKSVSFSVYSPVEIKFTIQNGESRDEHYAPNRNNNTYQHYTIVAEDTAVFYYENSQPFYNLTKFASDLIELSSEESFWRLHEYNLRIAYNTSLSPTYLYTEDLSCVTLYISLCDHCVLVVSAGKIVKRFEGMKSANILDNWQDFELIIEPGTVISLIRTSLSHDSGFWKLDIRRCSPVASINELKLDNKVTMCKLLNQDQFRKPESDNPVIQAGLLSCDAGLLGHTCNISCKELFGEKRKYCENTHICESLSDTTTCYCPWGSQGTSCDQTCSSGTWGLGCQRYCVGCTTCDKTTGQCDDGRASLEWIIMPILSLAIIVGTVIVYRKRKTRGTYRLEKEMYESVPLNERISVHTTSV